MRGIEVRLGDGDDEAATSGQVGDVAGPISLSGGEGRDTLRGSADPTYLDGGPVEDVLNGGSGNQAIRAVEAVGGTPTKMPTFLPDRDQVTCVVPEDAAVREYPTASASRGAAGDDALGDLRADGGTRTPDPFITS